MDSFNVLFHQLPIKESLNNEIKKINIEENYFTEVNYPFLTKPNFSTLGTIIEISKTEPIISFLPDDSIRKLLGFIASTIYEEYIFSPNPIDTLSFDNIFLETDIDQNMIFKEKRSVIMHNFTMDIDPG